MADEPKPVNLPATTARRDALLAQAMVALESRRPQDAERLAGEVIKADPRHSRALYILGSAALMQGHAKDAVASLEAAAHGRHDPEFDTMLAIALRQAGREGEALSRLKRATKRMPPYAAAFHELGSLLVAMGRDDEAIEALHRGINIAPMMPVLHIELGSILLRRRNCADAKVAFARALDISPNSTEALFGMAMAHREVGENAAAANYFRRYLLRSPNHWGAWLSLGHCLLELGERDAGYECFRTAARGDPQHYGYALASLVKSARGRFWLKPSAAARFLTG